MDSMAKLIDGQKESFGYQHILEIDKSKNIKVYYTDISLDKINKASEKELEKIIAFAPMGIFLPILFKKQNKLKNFILTNMAIILAIESLQFLSLTDHFDIDDLILNLLGSLIIYGLYKIKKINQLFFIKKV